VELLLMMQMAVAVAVAVVAGVDAAAVGLQHYLCGWFLLRTKQQNKSQDSSRTALDIWQAAVVAEVITAQAMCISTSGYTE
jgi:hypothetical protein